MRLFVALALAAALTASCATYRDDLSRAQTAFEKDDHQRALALFRALEPDTSHLSPAERAHYAYLRGMTDYRVGYRSDARHWLLMAQAMEAETPGVLPTDWRARMTETLTELDQAVYQNGIESLTNAPKAAKVEEPAAPQKKKSEDEP